MTLETGEIYFTGGNIIKIVGHLPNVGKDCVEAHTWVKSKKAFTKKTSCYGTNGTSNYQKLTKEDIENLSN